ncbi:hypothetical protein JDV02_001596 [Purpureocillium takamizusanense]|uniref:Uncharacterized protein n=1 Tax=Purpureocillium takamizusanense TaxID=2060973 RepID=A0A9Q8Q7G3_9HYPO|nr:uncharacterized protein JDV02_001596 [Purpureocillium takamizusanense]UNI15023.1 hypothetical protein JDV02_001596 [Purpureocillium takamizusanense]
MRYQLCPSSSSPETSERTALKSSAARPLDALSPPFLPEVDVGIAVDAPACDDAALGQGVYSAQPSYSQRRRRRGGQIDIAVILAWDDDTDGLVHHASGRRRRRR